MVKTPSNSSVELQQLSLQVQSLALQFQQQATRDDQKPQAPKTWWETSIQFLGLPVVLLGLLLTFSQIRSEQSVAPLNSAEQTRAIADAAKSTAETAKLNYELAELERRQASGRKIELDEIDRLIPRLRSGLQASMSQQARSREGTQLVLKFVALSLAWMAIGLLTSPFGLLWSSIIGLVYQIMNHWRPRYNVNQKIPNESREEYQARFDQQSVRWDKVERYWRYATLLLGPVPSVVDWSLRLLLFAAVAVPLFDQTAAFFGSTAQFSDIVAKVLSLDISGAISEVGKLIASPSGKW